MRRSGRRGFSLVEIMIVIVIIGLLNALILPALSNLRTRSQAARIASDFRLMKAGAEMCITELGKAPPNGVPSRFPADLLPYLPSKVTSGQNTAKNVFPNSRWTWDNHETNRRYDWKYGIGLRSISSFNANQKLMTEVDKILDDGDINSGYFFKDRWQGYTYALELHE